MVPRRRVPARAARYRRFRARWSRPSAIGTQLCGPAGRQAARLASYAAALLGDLYRAATALIPALVLPLRDVVAMVVVEIGELGVHGGAFLRLTPPLYAGDRYQMVTISVGDARRNYSIAGTFHEARYARSCRGRCKPPRRSCGPRVAHSPSRYHPEQAHLRCPRCIRRIDLFEC